MKKKLSLIFFFIIWILVFPDLIKAQEKFQISGIIFDNSNHSAIPYANIYLTQAKTGTISQNDGSFTLSVSQLPDTIRVSAIGYKTSTIFLNRISKREMTIGLSPSDIELDEIIIKPAENPANIVLRQVLSRKRQYNPDKINTLACNAYTRMLIKSKGNTEDDSTLEKGMPIFFSEKISQNYQQQTPYYSRGKIIAERQEGLGLLEELNIKGYANNLSNEFNFYDNIINYFDKPFISPLHSNAFMYYSYRMIDTLYTDFGKEYQIAFSPKNKNDPAFSGNMKVVADDWYISEITTRIPTQANLNFVNRIDIRQTFAPVNDSMIYMKENSINAELKITKDNAPIRINFTGVLNKRTLYSQVLLNFPAVQPGEEEAIWEKIDPVKGIRSETSTTGLTNRTGDSLRHSQEVLNLIRPEELSERELKAIKKIDSLNRHWMLRTVDQVSRMFITGYISGQYFEPGPYLEFFKYNKVEGYRFNLTGRTSQNWTKNILLFGHLGFGTRDQEWKYGAGIKYKLPSKHRQIVGFEYRNDLSKLGDNRSIFLIKENMMVSGDDNLLLSLFTNKPLEQLSREISYRGEYVREWKPGLETFIEASHRKVFAGLYFPFIQDGKPVDYLSIDELSLRIRLTREEKFTDNYCRRYYMNSDYPKLNLVLAGGHYNFGSVSNNYLRARMVVKHSISAGITRLNYILESGLILGQVPFPLLETHRTNQSLGNALYSFNMMDEMEYASDRFISLMTQYRLNGLIFNRIPLMNRLKLREVFSCKVLWSHLGNAHQEIATFQKPYTDAHIPYCELSAGIENLFKVARVDALWRLSQHETPTATRFGIRVRLHLSL